MSVSAGDLKSSIEESNNENKDQLINSNSIAEENRFTKGDIVKIVGLKSKQNWNDKLATIIGEFIADKRRWPIQMNTEDKSRALLKTGNLILDETALYEEFEEEIVEFKPRNQGPQSYMCGQCGARLYKKEAEIGFCYECETKKNSNKTQTILTQ